jgi:hypothetical protein
MSIDSALALAKRLKREREARDQPLVIFIVNCPEAPRLGFDLKSERMAMMAFKNGPELFEATDGETTKAFHRRLCAIARERGVRIVALGSDDPPQPVCRYNLDGTLKTPVEG